MESIKEVNSIFEQPWWLDAVAPGRWTCLEVKSNDNIVARWPFVKQKRLGFSILTKPKITQTLGPWIDCKSTNYIKYLAEKKDLLEKLLDQLPHNINIDTSLDCSADYFLPFKWKGCRVEPGLSYRFPDISDTDRIFKGIKASRKTIIKNASKDLIVRESDDISILIEMQKMTFGRQGRKLPIPEDIIYRVDKACREHNASFMLVAYDKEMKIHAASYFVYDSNICYYIMSGANPELRNSGAGSLLIWEGIKKASMLSKAFDFEGSTISDIEKNFRSFGAPFFVHYRVCRLNFILTMADYFKPKVKKLLGYK